MELSKGWGRRGGGSHICAPKLLPKCVAKLHLECLPSLCHSEVTFSRGDPQMTTFSCRNRTVVPSQASSSLSVRSDCSDPPSLLSPSSSSSESSASSGGRQRNSDVNTRVLVSAQAGSPQLFFCRPFHFLGALCTSLNLNHHPVAKTR